MIAALLRENPRGMLDVLLRRDGLGDDELLWQRCDLIGSCSDERLSAPLGAVAGAFGNAPRAGFVLHIGDDTTHDGAEVALLRDLWWAGLR